MKLIGKIRAYYKLKRQAEMIELLESLQWPHQAHDEEQEDKAKEEEVRSQNLRCKHCGEYISQYGPETFHIDSTMIRCENGETRAELADING